ncbi:hypothetical protein J7E81_15555 [Bacillus sp. ISL-18]|uniref:hypothetical protein n=1 Tax=Bacillus sp. ISL-18 TaxID=2819118 RepID=UPI001BE97080|nr:hypothetical protein [Bacillus sp. ISL-18]MBT2656635.1 hypothetical protein [Bacillus sp. ISL-18]
MTNNQTINKGVYIPSIEACDIWEHMNRDKNLYSVYVGFLPYSLEMIQLEKQGLNTFTSNRNPNKLLSRDVINLKFNNIVKDTDGYEKIYTDQLENATKQLNDIKQEYKDKKDSLSDKEKLSLIKQFNQTRHYKRSRKQLIKNLPDNWSKVSKEKLRHNLYENGFTIMRVDKNTDEIIRDSYKMYKRSSSKSRKGECLFVKESLQEKMIAWSRMFLPFKLGESVDLASLSAYQALVTSSIEKIIKIDPNSILVVDEVFSRWEEPEEVNVIKTINGEVDSVPIKNHPIENSIFDGEALLDSEFYDDNQSMMLLRSHFTKAAAFSTNLQLFFEDYAKEHGKDYETWTVTSMFNEEMPVKSIKMILNPTCIKFLKFSYLFKLDGENEKDHGHLWQSRMWGHWKKVVSDGGNIWGVCKHDKTNRKGEIDGLPLQSLSYQMVNSLEASPADIKELSKFEVNYIEGLKDDPEKFMKHVKLNLDYGDTNDEGEIEDNKLNFYSSDKMFIDLYQQDKEIIHTRAFKKFRADTIYNHVKYIKRGHIRLIGDYATLFSSPLNYLYHAVGETITEPIGLVGNQVYTTMFGDDAFGEELTIFRNPHTSASNIMIGKCIFNKDIEKYFNLSPNIIAVNSCKENIMNRLSGCDWDSDVAAIFFSQSLTKLANKSYGKYNVCVNELEADKTPYTLADNQMAALDHILSKAVTEIGSIVNEGQLCNALYWDYFKNGEVNKDIYKQTDILTILSMCSIDNAKRKYKIKIGSELRNIQKFVRNIIEEKFDGKKPNFFKYIDKKEGVEFTHYNTPMDYLCDILSNLEDAEGVDTWNFNYFLRKVNIDKANRKQRGKIKVLVDDLNAELKSIHSKKLNKNEKNRRLSDTKSFYLKKISKLKIKSDTMYSILKDIDDKKYNSFRLNLLNCLYQAHKETFLNCFKKSHG